MGQAWTKPGDASLFIAGEVLSLSTMVWQFEAGRVVGEVETLGEAQPGARQRGCASLEGMVFSVAVFIFGPWMQTRF